MTTANLNDTINALTDRIGAEALKRMADWEIMSRAHANVFQRQPNRMQLDVMVRSYGKGFANTIDGDIFSDDKLGHSIESSQLVTDLHKFANRVNLYRVVATDDIKEIRSGDFATEPYEEKGMTNLEEMKVARLTAALNAHKKKARIFEREFVTLMHRYEDTKRQGNEVLGAE